jgi:hypothetical protein
MDPHHFDSLARGIAGAGWTRRGLASVLVGGVLALLGSAAPGTEAKKKKKKKKKKKPEPSPANCTGSPPCATGCRDCGTFCIPDDDDHCCNQADCGTSDLFCNATTHRCECASADRGRCTGQDRIFCGPCCPGSDYGLGERCFGPNNELICVDSTHSGCRCPADRPNMCSAFNQIKCTFDSNRDPRVCGQLCQDCGTGFCCGGVCVGGCGHGTGGSCASGPCNEDCEPCPQGSTCCNFGSGSQCYEGMGTICFPP